MKKTLVSFLAFLLILSTPAVFAQMPVAVPLGVPSGMEQIGIVAAAKGKVELTMPGKVGRIAQSGQAVFMKDEIKTDAQGNLQILLLDETVFTIGPNSTLVIDEFVYDPKTQNGKVQASIAKGIFRYVSGKIAAKKPSNVTLKFPAATIGIRGTIVGGNVVPDGNSLAALLGPGANNNAGASPGSFTITGNGQGSQTIDHTGFGVTVSLDGGISNPFQLTESQTNALTAGLNPSGGGSNSGHGNGSATNQSGQGTVMTGENGNVSGSIAGVIDANNNVSTTAAQDATAFSGNIADGITTMEQLSRIQTGIFYYDATGAYSGVAGNYSAQIQIDFGARTIGGGNSHVIVQRDYYSDRTIPDANGLTPKPFGNSGNAVFQWTQIQGMTGGTFSVGVTLGNSGGVVANQATVTTNYLQGPEGTPPSGSVSAVGTRLPGAVPQ